MPTAEIEVLEVDGMKVKDILKPFTAYYRSLEKESCPRCGKEVTGMDQECPACGPRLAD